MSKPTQLATTEPEEIDSAIMEMVLLTGDLKGLTAPQRVQYNNAVCRSLSLNPLTRPFDYITLNGKLTLYARKDCTDQLRRRDGISIEIMKRETVDGVHIVTAKGKTKDGREDESIGVVSMVYLAGGTEKPVAAEARAMALMKAETKAKRRVTLSLAGLGIPDESEVEDVPSGVDPLLGARSAHEENAAETAKVIEAGGSVTVIEPKKARAARKPKESPVSALPWQDVECHVGQAGGPLLGKKLSELHRKSLEWLRDKWMTGLTTQTDRDATLIDAMAEYFKAHPEPPQEAPAPEPEAKPVVSEEMMDGSNVELDIATEEPPMDWRSVVVNIPDSKKGNGHTLGEFADAPPNFLGLNISRFAWFRAFLTGGIPKIEAKGNLDVKDRVLVNAIRAACEELKPFDDFVWLDYLNEDKLHAEIRRRFDAANVSSITRAKVLTEAAKLTNRDPASKEFLRHALEEWENVEALIEGEEAQ